MKEGAKLAAVPFSPSARIAGIRVKSYEEINEVMVRNLYGIVASLLITMVAEVNAQCCYCNSYEDYVAGQWTMLDTLYVNAHSKGRQFWWGGNDYVLKTGDKALDKYLKKDAFAVMQADTIYVNCRNLRFEGTRFGNGYTRARHIGNRSLLFVNRMIGAEAMRSQQTAAFMFGGIGAAISASRYAKQQVCYVISAGANSDNHVPIRIIDDALMEQMLEGMDSMKIEYYSEGDNKKRHQATHVVPILERAGLIRDAE